MSNATAAPLLVPAHGPLPSPVQLTWHRREVYGFIHFTMNTFTDREWGYGDEDPAAFNPSALDCHQWVAAAKAGGLTALILTAKHHDGFCLWPTATTAHSVARSPFRGGTGDLVKELADACRAGGLAFGLYCSPWDRNHAAYGQAAYTDMFHAQWRELLTGYGPLCEIWFDGANGGDGWYGGAKETRAIDSRTYYRFPELWATCAKHQPDGIRFSDAGPDIRWCGNESGIGSFTNWCKVRPEGFAPGQSENHDRLPRGDADGTVWRPSEVDVSLRPGWFWHPTERPRSSDELFNIWLASVGQNASLLLNLTPDRRGLIPTQDLAALIGFKSRVDAFTACDLARGRPVTVSSTAAGAACNLVDGDRDTLWAAAETTATITIELASDERLGGLRLEEAITHGQRITEFSVEVRQGGWIEIARGTTIGAQRILPFTQVRGSAIRIHILASQAAPVLARIQVYAAGD